MEIFDILEGEKLTLKLVGRLDTNTAKQLEDKQQDVIGKIKELVLDFKELEYVSSAGLRAILAMQKIMNKQGSMVLINVSADVNEIFEMTAFNTFLTIK